MRLFAFLFLVLVIFPQLVSAQSEEPEMKIDDAMNSMLDRHPFRVWIFRVMPRINLNSGYDSNALYSPSEEIGGDYFMSVAPGGSFAFRLGKSAFFVLEENLNFVYYKELDQLRDVYNTTSARLVTGSRRTLLTLNGTYFNRKTGVDSEFDVPVQQKVAFGGSNFEVGLGEKMNLNLQFSSTQLSYDRVEDSPEFYSVPPDTRQMNYGTSLDYWVHPRIAASVGTSLRTFEFLSRDTTRNSYRIFSGIRVRGAGIGGHMRVGFGQTESGNDSSEKLSIFVADGSMDFLLRDRTTMSIFLSRSHDVSRFGSTNFRLTTEGGIRLSYPFGSRMFADGSYRLGKNDYGVDSGEEIPNISETYHYLRSGLNFYMFQNLILRGGLIYYRRNSFQFQDQNRVAYDIGISYVVTPF